MGLSQIVAGVTVFLTGLMPLSCHKTATTASTQPKASPATIIVSPTSAPQHQLGDVSLTNHLETCLQLGGGKNCTLTPHMIDKHTVELTLALESRTPAGKIHDVSVTQVTAKDGQPLEVAVGDFQLSFTPNISSE
jgi:hypothetical protein